MRHRTGTRNFKIPKTLKGVDFLAGGAASRPNLCISLLLFGARCDTKEYVSAQHLEHMHIAKEAGDSYVATLIKNTPLQRIGLKKRPIAGEIFNPNIGQPPLDPLADLTTHLAKPGPAQLRLP